LNRYIHFFSLFVFSSFVYAQNIIPLVHDTKFIFDVGYFNAKEGKSQHINMTDLIGNDYTLNSSNQQNVLVGTGFYVPSSLMDIDFGLHFFYFNTTGVAGSIVQEDYFTNLAYNYNVINMPIYISGQKEFHFSNLPTSFLLNAGIGPNIISLYNYSEKPLTSYSLSNHSFRSSTRSEFSVNAGLGLKLSKQFELSYQFFYLGKSQLATNNSGVLNSLQTDHMYANTLVLSLII